MPKNCKNNHITLLVHSKVASFDWGKILIDNFTFFAVKEKYTVHIVYDARLIQRFDAPVIVIGVDSVWMNQTLSELENMSEKIILIYDSAFKSCGSINRICTDQRDAIQKSIKHLEQNGANKIAFFGVQNNDTSDYLKEQVFLSSFPFEDSYKEDGNVEKCCDRLIENIKKYDSIICSNDVMAIYLLGRCRKEGIRVPEDIKIIGNGNIYLSKNVTPPITTVTYNTEALVKMTIELCKNICSIDDFGTVSVLLSGHILQRESTGGCSQNEAELAQRKTSFFVTDDENVSLHLLPIVRLDRVLSCASQQNKNIITMLAKGKSVPQIAEKVFLSQDAVKYHIKKLYKNLGIHSKKELCDMIETYGIKL